MQQPLIPIPHYGQPALIHQYMLNANYALLTPANIAAFNANAHANGQGIWRLHTLRAPVAEPAPLPR